MDKIYNLVKRNITRIQKTETQNIFRTKGFKDDSKRTQ